uniref:non-specific serine/threonine protein kinase n=1 Tax=Oryza meridionalis TaxID=40149 RepID=A0A0E0DP29_9ORYZ
MRSSGISVIVVFRHHLAWLVLILCSRRVAAAQAQQAPKTDPVEDGGKKASWEWNISGELCSGFASAEIDWNYYPTINPFIKCDCSFSNNTLCHITKLRVHKLGVVGQIPAELQNLTHLEDLYELGNMTKLQQLYVASSGFSGRFPSTFSKLRNLKRASDNGFIGKIPHYFGSMTNLEDIGFEGNSFEGPIPENLSNLTRLENLILRNCKISGDLRALDFSKFRTLISLFIGTIYVRMHDSISSSHRAMYVKNNIIGGAV